MNTIGVRDNCFRMNKKENLFTKALFNYGWMTFQSVISLLVSLIVAPLTARYLGPTNYGIIGYATTIIALFAAVCDFGLNSILVNELSINETESGKYLGTGLIIYAIGASISIIGTVIVAFVTKPEAVIVYVVLLEAPQLLFQLYSVLRNWFEVKLDIHIVSIITVIAQLFIACAKIFFVCSGKSIYAFALCTTIQEALICIGVFFIFKKKNIKLQFNYEIAKKMMSKGKFHMLSSLAIVVYMKIDSLMIGNMLDVDNVAYYTTASALATAWQFVPLALINSFRPIVLASKNKSYADFQKKTQMLWSFISVFVLIYIIVMQFMARPIVTLLYGGQYMNAVHPLRLLSIASGISMIGVARGIWMISENFDMYSALFTVFSAIINIVLNYFLISFYGIEGAAISTIITYFIQVYIMTLFFKRTRCFMQLYVESFRCFPEAVKTIISHLKDK